MGLFFVVLLTVLSAFTHNHNMEFSELFKTGGLDDSK